MKNDQRCWSIGYGVFAICLMAGLSPFAAADASYQPVTVEEYVLYILQKCQRTEPLAVLYYDSERDQLRQTKFTITADSIELDRFDDAPEFTKTSPLNLRSMPMGVLGLANWSAQTCLHREISRKFPQISCTLQKRMPLLKVSVADIPVQDFYARIELWVNNPKEFHSPSQCLEPVGP